jgi:hypothetical protein
MIALYWKSGSSDGYTDLLPSWWFENDGEHASLRHDVEGPRGGLKTVKCSITVSGNTADVDYAGEHSAFNERIFPVGITRFVFEDTTRRRIESVMWKTDGEETFTEMTSDDLEWSTSHLSVRELTDFDPSDTRDGRKKIAQLVAIRQGQPAFRKALMAAYERRCAITGCIVEDVLEAAHISPYRGEHTNHVTNGMLLRADIHTLFDLGLIRVDSDYNVTAHPSLKSVYELPASIRLPGDPREHPNRDALATKWLD